MLNAIADIYTIAAVDNCFHNFLTDMVDCVPRFSWKMLCCVNNKYYYLALKKKTSAFL